MASQLCVSTLHTISTRIAYFGEVVDLGHVIQQQQHPLKHARMSAESDELALA